MSDSFEEEFKEDSLKIIYCCLLGVDARVCQSEGQSQGPVGLGL